MEISSASHAANTLHRVTRSRLPLPPLSLGAFLVAVLAVALIAWISYRSSHDAVQAAERVTHTLKVMEQIESFASSMKDAETGQRGFLIGGTEAYLNPYNAARAALPTTLQALKELTADNPMQLQRVGLLEQLARDKMEELTQTVELRRAGDEAGAMAIVRTDRGRTTMVQIRATIEAMKTEERSQLADRQLESRLASEFSARVVTGGSAVLLVLIAIAAAVAVRDHRSRESIGWIRVGQMGLAERLQGDQRLDIVADAALEHLAHYLGAQSAALYVGTREGRYQRAAGYALPPRAQATELHPGDGLLGEVLKRNRPMRVAPVPDGYLGVASSLGQGPATELLMAPATVDGVVQAVLEFAFFRPIQPADQELVARASEMLGVALRSAKDRSRLEELLEETQRQGEELQAQQEELRVSNEELEEQSRALKESQSNLENQQAELEQINSQLEEQTQLLEHQKQQLTDAQDTLTARAAELERSNQYKSEFLANMSHELRTPLNSSLILSKLLADNREGNLTPEQVKFAQTISSAGNDLLALINDILDLSKIEAGKVELDIEPVGLRRLVDTLARTLQPVAHHKGLQLTTEVDPETPEHIESDAQRLGQILRNLLSNALKFTPSGSVALTVAPGAPGTLVFSVRDTGIGIAPHQHELIFEAFRQADGSTHRRFGGTGLGLSISRDLARLLGGDITLQSEAGQGSTFSLTLPLAFTPAAFPLPMPAAPMPSVSPEVQPSGARPLPPGPANRGAVAPGGTAQPAAAAPAVLPPGPPLVEDDRDMLRPGARLILVVEDDPRFAAILRDLIHELDFQCIVTGNAAEGLAAASMYRPSAVLLDINLPDHSGLSVLDQLKRNPMTRHIPVHVASVADYAREARELGAVGYALKPVKREELIEALRVMEAKFSQELRRVLVVEDDARQRESIRQLLSTGDVEIVDASNAAEALAHLQAATFDCMVMDLNLPDLSGYELLEKMAGQEDVAFPPVIVYTGRSLTRDEEQRLRVYSRSIIVKDARSPERLLDEVTLFLHQVESKLPAESQRILKLARDRDATLENRRILVVEDDVRNIFALSSVLEPKGAKVEIARNGLEALEALQRSQDGQAPAVDLVLMDIMMPEMDGLTAMREIRKRPEWKKLPIIALTAKAMKDDQERCLAAGANDYVAKPLDVEKLLSLVRVWMPK